MNVRPIIGEDDIGVPLLLIKTKILSYLSLDEGAMGHDIDHFGHVKYTCRNHIKQKKV